MGDSIERNYDDSTVEELLAAAKGAMAALSQSVQFGDGSNTGSIKILQGDCSAARKFLSAAIAKFEGRQ